MTDSPGNRRRRNGDARAAAIEVLTRLVDAGFTAYFAGGCVRDRLLGLEPTDYDIATDARPDDVSRLFRRAHHVGESFGVMLVRSGGHVIEVATFRTDGVYSDGRRPDEVEFTDAEHDAGRRDFTINGMFEDPIAGRIIDFVDGEADLARRQLRAIGDPDARLREDRLRMLRAVRFAARFELAIEARTAEAIRSGASELTGVSRERIGHEVRKMLTDRNRAVAAWEMSYLGLDAPVLNEPNRTTAPVRVGRLNDEARFTTALAAWLLDRHPESVHDELETIAAAWTDALMLSNEERRQLLDSLRVHATLTGSWPSLGVARQKRIAASPAFAEGLALLKSADTQRFIDIRRQVDVLARTGLAPSPLLDGSDLIEAGMAPGPMFKRVLEAVYDAQLEGWLADKDRALEMAWTVARTEGDGYDS